MHTNAGVVTALQQAVAHLSSALETLTNADINMLMSTCCNMDAWRTHIWTTCLLRYRCSVQPRKHRRLFFLFFLAIVSARLSTWLQQSELSKFILTRPCLMKQVNNLWWTSPQRDAFKGLCRPLQKCLKTQNVWFDARMMKEEYQCSTLLLSLCMRSKGEYR